jgi:hypothetical protein
LHAVAALRRARSDDPALAERTLRIKRFQHERFRRSYADLLARPDLRTAATFFLDELYGPRDFSARDAQFERIVPALVRMLPAEIMGTVRQLSELHALSERLDHRMSKCFGDGVEVDRWTYRAAWQATGEPAARRTQIDLMMAIGQALSRYTRSPWLRSVLRMMRGPAGLAGLAALQQFLERGFDTFRGLPDPQGFLDTIARREAAIADWLFEEPESVPEPPGFK